MGLRRDLKVPANVQPTDLENPIPGRPDEETLEQALSGFPGIQSMQTAGPRPAPAVEPTMEQVLGEGLSAPQQSGSQTPLPRVERAPAAGGAGPEREQDQEIDDIFAELQSDERMQGDVSAAKSQKEQEDADAIFAELEGENVVAPPEDGANFFVRLFASIPKTSEGRLNALRKIYGDKNVKVDNGEFMLRADEAAPWFKFNKEGFQAGDLADYGADVAEGGLATLAGIAAGAGSSMTGPGAVAIGVGTSAATAGAISAARSGVVSALGIEEAPDFSAVEDALWTAGIDAATMGTFALAGAGGRAVRQVWKRRLSARLENAQTIRLAVDDIYKSLRMPKPTDIKPGQLVSEKAAGTEARSAIEFWQNHLEQRVSMNRAAFYKAAKQKGVEVVPMPSAMKKLREIIGDRAAEIDETGKLALRIGEDMDDDALRLAQEGAWGDPNGKMVVEKLVNTYNRMNALMSTKGGVPASKMFELVEEFGALSKFDKNSPFNDRILANYRQIRNSMASDRNKVMTEVLGDVPEGKTFIKDFEQYSEKIGIIGDFMSAFEKKPSAEKLVDAILQPRAADKFRQLEQILGKDSEHIERIRSLWLMQRVDKSIDANGVFQGAKFLKEIDKNKWGEEMVKQLMPDGSGTLSAYNKLIVAAKDMEKIKTSDFFKQGAGLDQLMSAFGQWFYWPRQAAASVFKVLRENPDAAEAFSREGLERLSAKAKTQEMKQRIMEGMSIFDEMINQSKRVQVKRGGKTREVLVPISARAFNLAFKTGNAAFTDRMQNQGSPGNLGGEFIQPSLEDQLLQAPDTNAIQDALLQGN